MITVNAKPYSKRGTVYPGKWELEIRIKFPDDLPPHRWKRMIEESSERKAKQWGMTLAQALLAKGRPTQGKPPEAPPKVTTFEVFSKEYLSRWVTLQELEEETKAVYERHLRLFLLPVLGPLSLDAIDATQLDLVREKVRAKPDGSSRSPKYRNMVMTLLHHMLKKAEEWGRVNKVPRMPPLVKGKPREIEMYTATELARLREKAKETSTNAYLIVLLGSEAGLRIAELIGLRWSDIDLKAGHLVVRQQEPRAGKVKPPKSKKSRKVPLSDLLWSALKAAKHLNERVLVDEEGRPLRRGHVEWLLRQSAKRAGVVVHKSPHKLRHSFASQLLASGASPKVVQELLGHAGLGSTYVYLHLQPGEAEAAIRRLSGARMEPKEGEV